jgi:hypothetical protein
MNKTSKAAAAVAATLALAAAVGMASAAQRGTMHQAASGGGGVSKADFDRLEGQVEDLQRRVAALEHGGGAKGGGTKGHPKTAGDDWETPH